MKRLTYLTILLLSSYGCTRKPDHPSSSLEQLNSAKYGQDSKIIEFQRIAIMDTVTAIIEGQLTLIVDNKNLQGGSVVLANGMNIYETTSDINGQFRFFHIAAGMYKLTANHPDYKELVKDSLHLGTGDIANLKIGMASVE